MSENTENPELARLLAEAANDGGQAGELPENVARFPSPLPQAAPLLEDDAAAEGGRQMAAMGLETIAATLEAFTGCKFDVAPDMAGRFAERVGPLIVKYAGGEAPEWLARWRVEIDAAQAVAVVGLTMWGQYRAQKAAEKEAANDGDQPDQRASA